MSNHRRRSTGSKYLDRYLGLVALFLIVVAWFVGGLNTQADHLPYFRQLLPTAHHFQHLKGGTYAAWSDQNGTSLLAYLCIIRAKGYGGPVTMAVAVDSKGTVIGLGVVDHKDTPSYFNQIVESGLLDQLMGKSYRDSFLLNQDVDGVSGATLSGLAVVTSVRQAVKEIARQQLDLDLPDTTSRKVRFGPAEIILILLFALGILARRKFFPHTKTLRWVSLLTGLICFGFVYNNPLTISIINQLLLGFWPDWHSNLFTYLLVAGILLHFLLEGRSPYCTWICPFGAAQECLGKLMKAKPRHPRHLREFLKWLHRGLALTAILVALLLRDPGLTSYEVFGTFFQMWGSSFQFLIIALVFLMSTYVLRPWCNYICPIHPVDAYLRMMKNWIKELWRQRKTS